MDLQGKTIKIIETNAELNQINLADIVTGVYIIRVSQKGISLEYKLSKL